MSRSALLARLLWAWPVLAGPGTAADLTEALFLADLPPVLTASRLEQSPLDAPAPVTVIDREMIEASGFTEIHDLLRLVPGFLVADWPEGAPVVVNHGLGDGHPRRLQVLIDGRSVLDPFRGGVDWQDLPIRVADIDRVEVVRGPNHASYGANAFQGVINIITRAPAQDSGAELVVSRGGDGFEDTYFRLGRASRALDWRVSASSRASLHFQDRSQSPEFWHESSERQSLNARLAWRPADGQEWNLQLGLSQSEELAGTTLQPYTSPYRSRDDRDLFLQLGWRRAYGADSEISLQYFHYASSENEPVVYTNPSVPLVIPVDYAVEVWRDDLEFQHTFSFAQDWRAAWGAGVRQDRVESPHYLYGLDGYTGRQWQLFGDLEWQASARWLLHLGGMVEKHYQTDTLVSPRLAVNFAITPRQSLRLSAGRGYRAPTILEGNAREAYTYPGGIADVGLWSVGPVDPETLSFSELGYVAAFDEINLHVDARVFQNEYGGLIDSKSCRLDAVKTCTFDTPAGYERPIWPGGNEGRFGHNKAYVFYNSGDIKLRGGEVALDWRHPVLGRFVFAHAVTDIEAGPNTDKDTEVSAPTHTTSLLWSKAFPHGVRTSLGYYRVGDMMWPSDGDEQPSYRRIDFKLAKRFQRPDAELALTLQNLNDRHTEFDQYLAVRQAFVTLRLGW